MKKKLPLGIQTFEEIRDPRENYVYIDKTGIAFDLISNLKYVFLSRPRRFGKSLFLDTLACLFEGKKQLFEGLAIHDRWDWSESWPVIRISFGSGEYPSAKHTEDKMYEELRNNASSLGVDAYIEHSNSPGISFERLINCTVQKYGKKVVILVDEYDKPILDTITEKEKASEIRGSLGGFYSAIKSNDRHVRFAMLAGVSKFTRLSLFSHLNNLTDITTKRKYATITGYTHADLLREFGSWFDGVDMEEVRRWYNGYNYFGEPIYNPFDILQFLNNECLFQNYWWETGNPRFLVELLAAQPRYLPDLENMVVSEEILNSFDVEYIDLCALLWQTGYLTFDKEINLFNRISYKLKVPNIEIQSSLNSLFFDYLASVKVDKSLIMNDVAFALYSKDIKTVHTKLFSLFASISHHNYSNNIIATFEGYYASVMFAFMASLGFDVVAEDTTNHGRIDMTIKVPGRVYIVEFKVDMPAEAALAQCHERRYHEKYLADGRPITLVGIHFDSQKRNIAAFEVEDVIK